MHISAKAKQDKNKMKEYSVFTLARILSLSPHVIFDLQKKCEQRWLQTSQKLALRVWEMNKETGLKIILDTEITRFYSNYKNT